MRFYGGCLPGLINSEGFSRVSLINGLPQIKGNLLSVEVLTGFFVCRRKLP